MQQLGTLIRSETLLHQGTSYAVLEQRRIHNTTVYLAAVNAPAGDLFAQLATDPGQPLRDTDPLALARDAGALIAFNGCWIKFWLDRYNAPGPVILTRPAKGRQLYFPQNGSKRKGKEALLIFNDGRMRFMADNRIIGGNDASTAKNVAALLEQNVRHVNCFGPVLVRDGVYATPLNTDGPQPRTAIGQTSTGQWLVAVCEGRIPGALGLTLPQLALFMQAADCAQAYNLDGGGSSFLAVRRGNTLVPLNRPSDGAVRRTTDIFLFAPGT